MKTLMCLLVTALPWSLKRRVLERYFGYRIHPTARIGLSWIYPKLLIMGEQARIGHFNVAIHLDRVELGAFSSISRGNWITGFPSDNPVHFTHCVGRDPSLILGAHSAIVKDHHFDCTDRIEIGAFTTIGGYQSQFLTHAIDVVLNRQDAAPISIGDYCFVGTNVVVLGGTRLPDRSFLGAKALLNKSWDQPDMIYAGVPALPIKPLPEGAAYFTRTSGFVY